MTAVFLIARDELRYLRRSNAAWFILLTLLLVSICAAIVSDAEVSRRAEERLAHKLRQTLFFRPNLTGTLIGWSTMAIMFIVQHRPLR